MQPWKAHVQNGRLVLDEPTDLPDGTVVEVVPVEWLVDVNDGMDDEERAALHGDLEASFTEEAAGQVLDLAEVLAELRRSR